MFSLGLAGPGRGSRGGCRRRGAPGAAGLAAAAWPCPARTWSISMENPGLISFAGISKQVRKKAVIERKSLIYMRKKHVAAGPSHTCDKLFQLNRGLRALNDGPGITSPRRPQSGHGEISQTVLFTPPDPAPQRASGLGPTSALEPWAERSLSVRQCLGTLSPA